MEFPPTRNFRCPLRQSNARSHRRPSPDRKRCSPISPARPIGSPSPTGGSSPSTRPGVTFRYKDYRRDGADRQRVMTLTADEFIRRFLLHILHRGFHRIRHYGLLAGSARKASIARASELLAGRAATADTLRAGGTARRTPTLSVLRRAHDHQRDVRALGPTARAALCCTATRDDPAVTRHGPNLLRAAATPLRPSTRCAPRSRQVLNHIAAALAPSHHQVGPQSGRPTPARPPGAVDPRTARASQIL